MENDDILDINLERKEDLEEEECAKMDARLSVLILPSPFVLMDQNLKARDALMEPDLLASMVEGLNFVKTCQNQTDLNLVKVEDLPVMMAQDLPVPMDPDQREESVTMKKPPSVIVALDLCVLMELTQWSLLFVKFNKS